MHIFQVIILLFDCLSHQKLLTLCLDESIVVDLPVLAIKFESLFVYLFLVNSCPVMEDVWTPEFQLGFDFFLEHDGNFLLSVLYECLV